jgi:adenylate cyclase
LNLIDDLFLNKSDSSPQKSESPSSAKKPDNQAVPPESPTEPSPNADTKPKNGPGEDLPNQQAALLVVDDKETNRDLFRRRLEKKGYDVETAENGRQAIEMIRAENFDLVLLDIIMPEMDGFQVLERLKQDQELRSIPVIMTSALDEIKGVVRCIEMGAEDYLQKPVEQVILNAKISATLERKRLRDKERDYIEQLKIKQKRLQEEQDKSEQLLLNILPEPIAKRLKENLEDEIADYFPDVTVLFSDLVGFTQMSTGTSAQELVKKLNQIFSAFDDLTEKYGLEKIKTIGDAYMLVGGVPTERADHVEAVAQMGLEMLKEIQRFNKENQEGFKIRVGIHTGPVVAGVIGKNKFIYDLWGDTVNTASRMESQGLSDRIQVSEDTYDRIKDKFVFEPRGRLDIKGKGKMQTYILKEKKPDSEPNR